MTAERYFWIDACMANVRVAARPTEPEERYVKECDYLALEQQLEAARRDAAESERQLGLYRKAINRMDDMTEYARPGLTKEQLRAIFAELTAGLARHETRWTGEDCADCGYPLATDGGVACCAGCGKRQTVALVPVPVKEGL